MNSEQSASPKSSVSVEKNAYSYTLDLLPCSRQTGTILSPNAPPALNPRKLKEEPSRSGNNMLLYTDFSFRRVRLKVHSR